MIIPIKRIILEEIEEHEEDYLSTPIIASTIGGLGVLGAAKATSHYVNKKFNPHIQQSSPQQPQQPSQSSMEDRRNAFAAKFKGK